MKIVMLDVDGVLNHVNDFKGRKTGKVLNEDMVKRFDQIIIQTKAKVVLSSTWRKYKPYRNYLRQYVKFIDVTPDFEYMGERTGARGAEIQFWLENYKHVTNYVIIDDDWDFLEEQRPFVVLTEWLTGLQDCHVEKAIEILNKDVVK